MRGGRLIVLIFFVSGLSSLLYQVAWLKSLGLVFGNTVWATATLIAVFLAGLGLGGFWFARHFLSRPPLLIYAALESLIGLIGAFSPNAFALLDSVYVALYPQIGDQPLTLGLMRAALAALFLLIPTILMGGTLPVLVRFFTGSELARGRAASSLYSANTFGATAGVALSGFWLIPVYGILATIFSAAVLNFVLALGSAALAYALKLDAQPAAAPMKVMLPSRGFALGVLAASFFMGFSSIADEVFWTRVLVLHLGSSVYAFALMLFSFLVGIALGSALIYPLIEKIDLVRWLSGLEIALAVALALQVHYFTRFSDVLGALATFAGETGGYGATLAVLLAATLSALVIPTALMGATFPIAVKLYSHAAARSESDSVGTVYLVNTAGSILGSLAAGFVLIRLVGSQNGLFVMAAVNLVIGVAFAAKAAKRRAAFALAGAGALATVISFAAIRPNQMLMSAGLFVDDRAEVIVFREDVSATVTLRRMFPAGLSLELNGVNVAGTEPSLIGTQKLQGHLPLLMHPDPKRVLHIGFGSGGTAWSVSLYPVEEIRIAEISPEVLEVSDRYLREVNRGVLSDPRVKVEINDGRNFVLATPESFDILLSDSIHPRYAGNGSLYTKDYFQLCREVMEPDGVISMWLPMYSLTPENYAQILRAFYEVFPNMGVWYVPNVSNSFTIVIGRLESGPLPMSRIMQGIEGRIAAELSEIGVRNGVDIASMLLLDGPAVARLTDSLEPHVDDIPVVEYESGRFIDRELSWLANFRMLAASMSPLGPALEGLSAEEIERAEALRLARVEQHIAQLEVYIRERR